MKSECVVTSEQKPLVFFFLSSFLLPFSSFKSAVTPKSLPFMDTPALLESSFFIEVFHTGSFQSFGSVSAPWGQSINLIPLQHDSLSNRLRQLPHLPGIFFFSQSLGHLPKGSSEPFSSWLMCSQAPLYLSLKQRGSPDLKLSFSCRGKKAIFPLPISYSLSGALQIRPTKDSLTREKQAAVYQRVHSAYTGEGSVMSNSKWWLELGLILISILTREQTFREVTRTKTLSFQEQEISRRQIYRESNCKSGLVLAGVIMQISLVLASGLRRVSSYLWRLTSASPSREGTGDPLLNVCPALRQIEGEQRAFLYLLLLKCLQIKIILVPRGIWDGILCYSSRS